MADSRSELETFSSFCPYGFTMRTGELLPRQTIDPSNRSLLQTRCVRDSDRKSPSVVAVRLWPEWGRPCLESVGTLLVVLWRLSTTRARTVYVVVYFCEHETGNRFARRFGVRDVMALAMRDCREK